MVGDLWAVKKNYWKLRKWGKATKPQKELKGQCHACSKFTMAIVRTGQCFQSFFLLFMYPHSTSSSLSLILSKWSLYSLLNKTQSTPWVKTTVLVLMRHLSLLFSGLNSSGPIMEKLWEGLKSELIHNAVIFVLCRFNKHKSKCQAHQKNQSAAVVYVKHETAFTIYFISIMFKETGLLEIWSCTSCHF